MAGVEEVLIEILERGLPKSEAQRQLLIEVVKGKEKLPSQGHLEAESKPEQQQTGSSGTRSRS